MACALPSRATRVARRVEGWHTTPSPNCSTCRRAKKFQKEKNNGFVFKYISFIFFKYILNVFNVFKFFKLFFYIFNVSVIHITLRRIFSIEITSKISIYFLIFLIYI